MRNPFARKRAPDTAALDAHQQVITLAVKLGMAQATIVTLRADIAQLRAERDEAQRNYEFYFDEYRRNCTIGGKHQ